MSQPKLACPQAWVSVASESNRPQNMRKASRQTALIRARQDRGGPPLAKVVAYGISTPGSPPARQPLRHPKSRAKLALSSMWVARSSMMRAV